MFPREEPWVPGSCLECKRFELSQTSTREPIRECPYCKRHWYKYDFEKKLWRQIVNSEEWTALLNQLYQINSYSNLRGEERVTNDPRVGVVVDFLKADNDEQAKQAVLAKYGQSQDVDVFNLNGRRKLEF